MGFTNANGDDDDSSVEISIEYVSDGEEEVIEEEVVEEEIIEEEVVVTPTPSQKPKVASPSPPPPSAISIPAAETSEPGPRLFNNKSPVKSPFKAAKPTTPSAVSKTPKSTLSSKVGDLVPGARTIEEKRELKQMLKNVKAEADREIEELKAKRIADQKAKLGISDAGDGELTKSRKTNIHKQQEEYAALSQLRNLELDREKGLEQASGLQDRKQALQADTERIAIKGKDASTVQDDTILNSPQAEHSPTKLDKAKFEKDTSKVPSLFSAPSQFAPKKEKVEEVKPKKPKVWTKQNAVASAAAKDKADTDTSTTDDDPKPANWDGTFYTLVDIRQRRVPNVDKLNREYYLSPEEFLKTFKMNKVEFSKLPKWKRDKAKSALHLF